MSDLSIFRAGRRTTHFKYKQPPCRERSLACSGIAVQSVAQIRYKEKRLENLFSSLGECPKTRQLAGGVRRQYVIHRILLAGRLVGDAIERVTVAEGRAARRAHNRVLQIRLDVGEGDGCGGAHLVLQRPLLGRAVNLTQVVDAGVLLRLSPGADEVGNRDCG